MSRVAGSFAEVASRLREERALAGRGLVVVLESTAPLESDRLLEALGTHEVIDLAHASDAELERLNQRRDVLLPGGTSVVFHGGSAQSVRRALRLAPDLTSVIDVSARVDSAVALATEELLRRLRDTQRRLHGSIELTGLLPHTREQVSLPMEAVYSLSAGLPKVSFEARPSLVLGAPGSGKTTTLRWVAWSHAGPATKVRLPALRVAVYVPLAAWAALSRDRTVPLRAHLEQFVGSLVGVERVFLDEHLPRLTFLLDGLDEVGRGARRSLLDAAEELFRDGALVIVSARDYVADDLLPEHHARWAVCRLGELSPKDAGGLVRTVLQSRGTPTDRATALTRQILRRPDFTLFARSPLLLTFLVIVASISGQVPTHRAELYGDLVEMLITSWRRLRQVGTGRSLRRGDVLRVVAPLGWELVERGVGGLTEAELIEVLVELERRNTPGLEAATARARERVEELRSDTALLRTSDGLWRFNHPTIAEYLAAHSALQDPRRLGLLAERVYDPKWQEVLAFTIAIAVDLQPRDDVASTLLDALERKAEPRHVSDANIPRTLGHVLGEVAGLDPHRRVTLVDHTARIALSGKLSSFARAEAVSALATQLERDPVVRDVVSEWLSPPRVDGLRLWRDAPHWGTMVGLHRLLVVLETEGGDVTRARQHMAGVLRTVPETSDGI